jgi:molybdate transport system substrate-binding protein
MNRVFILLFFVVFAGTSAAQDKILVAAASDLKFALDSLVAQFHKLDKKSTVDVVYGASGKLSEQIIHGAPFDLFLSADISYPRNLKEQGKTSSEVYPYAKGHIVIWSKKIDPSQSQMRSLTNPSIRKIAIANPQHAPYGKRAVESLEHYKLFEAVRDKLVYGENISQTAQFISTGAADIGIIALSLALSPNMKVEHARYYLIPEESHRPLIQGAVITAHGKGSKLAAVFFDYKKTDAAMAVFEHFGLSRP